MTPPPIAVSIMATTEMVGQQGWFQWITISQKNLEIQDQQANNQRPWKLQPWTRNDKSATYLNKASNRSHTHKDPENGGWTFRDSIQHWVNYTAKCFLCRLVEGNIPSWKHQLSFSFPDPLNGARNIYLHEYPRENDSVPRVGIFLLPVLRGKWR